jgi:hypothetical protein
MPTFNADYVKLLVFQAAREEFEEQHDEQADASATGKKNKSNAETVVITDNLKEQWRVSLPQHLLTVTSIETAGRSTTRSCLCTTRPSTPFGRSSTSVSKTWSAPRRTQPSSKKSTLSSVASTSA